VVVKMSCEHVGCDAPGVIGAHGGRWCKYHISDINRVRKDLDAIKPVRKGMLEFVGGRLILAKSEDKQVVNDFLSGYKKNNSDEATRKRARAILGQVAEKLRLEVSQRLKERRMRKRKCAGHDKFLLECTLMIERAEIDVSKTELVDDVESVMSRDMDDAAKNEMIDYYNKRHEKRIMSIKFDVGRMEADV
jgi:hypothetical protein